MYLLNIVLLLYCTTLYWKMATNVISPTIVKSQFHIRKPSQPTVYRLIVADRCFISGCPAAM